MINRTKFYIGSDHLEGKEWTGTLYPKERNEKTFLEYYSDTFNFIELYATYHKFYTYQIEQWINQVNDKSFKFCPWIPQKFLFRSVKPTIALTGIVDFLSMWNNLTDKVGPFTLPVINQNCISIKERDKLNYIIENLPQNNSYVLNIDNSTGNTNSIMEDLTAHANKHSIGLKLKDSELFNQVKSRFLYLKINIGHSPDFEKIISDITDNVKEVYLCLTGTDKIKLLENLKKLVPLQYI